MGRRSSSRSPGAIVFVNAGSGSFEFLETLAGRGRIVLTAADSAAQQYETVFPQFFIEAFAAEEADLDRDGKVSIWEAFQTASAGVKGWFEDQGRLATERPILDDNGDGIGREAAESRLRTAPWLESPICSAIDPAAAPADAELAALLRQRADLQSRIERCAPTRRTCPPISTSASWKRCSSELARLERQIPIQVLSSGLPGLGSLGRLGTRSGLGAVRTSAREIPQFAPGSRLLPAEIRYEMTDDRKNIL